MLLQPAAHQGQAVPLDELHFLWVPSIDWDLALSYQQRCGLPGAGLLAVLHRHEEDVLGLQVCMYQLQLMQVGHALQQLLPK